MNSRDLQWSCGSNIPVATENIQNINLIFFLGCIQRWLKWRNLSLPLLLLLFWYSFLVVDNVGSAYFIRIWSGAYLLNIFEFLSPAIMWSPVRIWAYVEQCQTCCKWRVLWMEEQCKRAACNRKSRKSPEGKRYMQHGRGYREKLDYHQLRGWIRAT